MDKRDELLATVASLYYNLNLGQNEIAARLECSTATVSRLLREAKERGIVEIHIRMPIPRDLKREQALIKRFGLKDAYVLRTSADADPNTLLTQVGMLASTYVERIIDQFPLGGTIGVAWGTGVHALISAIANNFAQNIDVVHLLGGIGASAIDTPDLARMVAQKLGGRHYDMLAPVMVERPIAWEILMEEPTVRDALLRARQVQLAITGIGTVEAEESSFLRAKLLTRDELATLRAQGVVGEMCGRFFDIHGDSEAIGINQRIIGIALDDLRKIPHSIAIARGPLKVRSIIGALRGAFVKVLATDDITAQQVIEETA